MGTLFNLLPVSSFVRGDVFNRLPVEMVTCSIECMLASPVALFPCIWLPV